MKFSFVSLFPQLIEPYFKDSILARAVSSNKINLSFVNPRDYTKQKNLKVDEYMIGGGAGLLMFAQPIDDALSEIKKNDKSVHIIFLTPAAKKFNQNDAKRLAKKDHICFVCGRYEGIDERIIEMWADEVFSIGDYVLTGGELGALCMSDAISRNIDGVLGNNESLAVESFEDNLLEAPSFAKPDLFKGSFVVSEFLKGNHGKIQSLKNRMAHCKTKFFRPDLYQKIKP
ncbi:tRNA (guanosine(37)-N1)-methyltransferase TrmD [Campylobacter sp. RM9344]|uniref:tRNA (guanine-N(1)-)-methyltransferase n=1 Tax=Campylobacter californiensis TaxID=1032243 RepID=A0AAW3ZRF2_9BACT|nr:MULTISPECIES: tRNA (guanosine(37)-N1)-methyltransferase TrmD [unclassified Campylobacter]MBE2983967.1 tRNA (guanosine(37)-N1)-methyltransferase TrmD [Campylobacter sp. RM6883]MBE2986129.1 tRNA (guanosine(37)-N1)-methyltransferase TrmD [Campylobacter sp. RM12919]MBE2994505.1 tRNA (guanosine(37)-N1)-methyltransferase TrmD [Campylobacter sp. RM6913]MBE3022499.1 tRNA (guanosine(37)-N1)-methyltransferase TrmD [Campylobacter sp. 7477a]MBE3028813.1 tRNA (guanosine(37)-N1)-methyltransferase TrmD [C